MKYVALVAGVGLCGPMLGCGGGGGGGSSPAAPISHDPLDKIYFSTPKTDTNAAQFFSMNRDGTDQQPVPTLSKYDPDFTQLGQVDPTGAVIQLSQNLANNQLAIIGLNLQTGQEIYHLTGQDVATFNSTDLGSVVTGGIESLILNSTKTKLFYTGDFQPGDDLHNVYSMNLDGSGKTIAWTAPQGSVATVVAISPDEKTLFTLDDQVQTFNETIHQVAISPGGITSDFKLPAASSFIVKANRQFTTAGYLDLATSIIPGTSSLSGGSFKLGKGVPILVNGGIQVQIADFDDGFLLLYITQDKLGVQQIFSANMDGTGIKQLTFNSEGQVGIGSRSRKNSTIRMGVR